MEELFLSLPSLGMSLISAPPCLPPTEPNRLTALKGPSLASIGLMLSLPHLSEATVVAAALSSVVVGKVLVFAWVVDAQF